jgi:hypothetical protein
MRPRNPRPTANSPINAPFVAPRAGFDELTNGTRQFGFRSGSRFTHTSLTLSVAYRILHFQASPRVAPQKGHHHAHPKDRENLA